MARAVRVVRDGRAVLAGGRAICGIESGAAQVWRAMRPIGLGAAQRPTCRAATIDWSEPLRCWAWLPIGVGCSTVRSGKSAIREECDPGRVRSGKKSCGIYENTVAPVSRLEAPRSWIVWNKPSVVSSVPRNRAVRRNCLNIHNRFMSPECQIASNPALRPLPCSSKTSRHKPTAKH